MNKDAVKKIVDSIYPKVQQFYGLSKFNRETNTIWIYYPEATNKEWVIQTLIHEYIHYLQSPLWMKRYYDMGYEYDTHPYELAATKAEDNWKTFA